MPPRTTRALLRPNAGALLILTGSALAGFSIRHFSASRDSDSSSSGTLHPSKFTRYTIADRTPVSSTSSLFTLQVQHAGAAKDSLKEVWENCVWSVEVKQPQLQISRAYTPLPPPPPLGRRRDDASDSSTVTSTTATNSSSSSSSSTNPATAAADAAALNTDSADANSGTTLRLLIRHTTAGEVSSYLHRLPLNATIELRGPHTEFAIPGDVGEVLFLAGGTGIAPALQVAHAVLSRGGTGRVRVLWAVRGREECVGGVSGDGEDGRSGGRWWERLVGLGSGWGKGEVDKVVGRVDAAAQEEEKGVIVRELEALKKAVGTGQRLDVEYFVDEEKSFITPATVKRCLQASAEQQQQHGSRLIMVSGPDGFLDYWSGRKVWAEEGEVQGPLRGELARMDLKGWKVWKL